MERTVGSRRSRPQDETRSVTERVSGFRKETWVRLLIPGLVQSSDETTRMGTDLRTPTEGSTGCSDNLCTDPRRHKRLNGILSYVRQNGLFLKRDVDVHPEETGMLEVSVELVKRSTRNTYDLRLSVVTSSIHWVDGHRPFISEKP